MAPCNCGSGGNPRPTYTLQKPDGTSRTYSTQIEALAAAQRTPGSVVTPS